MADLIIIRGQQQSGKTTTTGMVYQALLRLSEPEHEFDNRLVSKDSLRFNSHGSTMDFTAILTVKNKRIGIVSEGDIADFVRPKLRTIINRNVDIIICCARTRDRSGSTYRMILDEFASEHRIVSEIFTEFSENREEQFTIKEPIVNEVVETVLSLL
ncbi:MAG: hypothetical protein RL308_94 [Bacteroidota bacterium]|jgi:hypothetical protein